MFLNYGGVGTCAWRGEAAMWSTESKQHHVSLSGVPRSLRLQIYAVTETRFRLRSWHTRTVIFFLALGPLHMRQQM